MEKKYYTLFTLLSTFYGFLFFAFGMGIVGSVTLTFLIFVAFVSMFSYLHTGKIWPMRPSRKQRQELLEKARAAFAKGSLQDVYFFLGEMDGKPPDEVMYKFQAAAVLKEKSPYELLKEALEPK